MNAIILGSGAVSARQEHVVTVVYVQKRGRKDFLMQERVAVCLLKM